MTEKPDKMAVETSVEQFLEFQSTEDMTGWNKIETKKKIGLPDFLLNGS
jgi:hypothetical protein